MFDDLALDLVNVLREDFAGRVGIDINKLPPETLDALIERLLDKFGSLLLENAVQIYTEASKLTTDEITQQDLLGLAVLNEEGNGLSYVPPNDDGPMIVTLGTREFLRALSSEGLICYISLESIYMLIPDLQENVAHA
jgi:hypothetical protein